MTLEDLRIGEVVGIVINDDRSVNTTIEDIQGNDIWVSDIMIDIFMEPWRERAFDVRVVRDGKCYTFLVEVVGREKQGNLFFTHMICVSNITQIQRRASYRLPDMFPIYLRPAYTDEPYWECRGMDISEKGAGLITTANWKVGEKLDCMFELAGEPYSFVAKVRRRVEDLNEETDEVRLGIEFMDVETGDNVNMEHKMQKLRKYVFKQQIERQR